MIIVHLISGEMAMLFCEIISAGKVQRRYRRIEDGVILIVNIP